MKVRKIIAAFDSFKGCITAEQACRAAAEGIHDALPSAETVQLPLSDGGEGLVSCIKRFIPLYDIALKVHGPLMEWVDCSYALGLDGKTAFMEMAAASGLPLVPEDRRNPLLTTTYGVGEMIADAIDRGCERIVMGIGGSATCDAGEGMLKALRDLDCRTDICSFLVACDVNNPLYGENGAAYVFGSQKGASPEQLPLLDGRLRQFAAMTEKKGIAAEELADYPGAGAAGGLGYAFLAYLDAELRPGIDILLDIADFDALLRDADLVITGEGRSDAQTLMGKLPYGVLQRCRRAGVPLWLLSGAIDTAAEELSHSFSLVRSINENDPRPLPELLQPERAMENLKRTVSYCLKEYSW